MVSSLGYMVHSFESTDLMVSEVLGYGVHSFSLLDFHATVTCCCVPDYYENLVPIKMYTVTM